MSTLQEEDETEELQHPSACIADDPETQGLMVEEEGDKNQGDDLILDPRAVYYSADDMARHAPAGDDRPMARHASADRCTGSQVEGSEKFR